MNIQERLPTIFTPSVSPAPALHRFSIDGYHRMGEAAIFAPGDHVELIYGLILEKHTNGVPYRFSVEQYHRMIETGILGKYDKVELIEGLILEMFPRSPERCYAGNQLFEILRKYESEGWHVRVRAPLTFSNSEPEPQISIVRGRNADYKTRHPGARDAVLAIEVADASLEFDRQIKLPIYAAAGVPEYWIVNLRDRQVEIHRDPRSAAPGDAAGAATYHVREVIRATGKLSLMLDGQPRGEIVVAAVLP